MGNAGGHSFVNSSVSEDEFVGDVVGIVEDVEFVGV
jgi:hypothetical protein